jgi:D-glycero-alpha-D-manno-heptose-7-phosphate kinase
MLGGRCRFCRSPTEDGPVRSTHERGSFARHAAHSGFRVTVHKTVATAPARVDLAGGWTDVAPYTTEVGGAVCNVAIEMRASATVTRVAPGDAQAPAEPLVRAAWERAGRPDVNILLHSGITVGSGLGGSSAAGVALAAALAAIAGASPTPHELAELSRRTETETLGVPGGCQDHFAAAFGGALLLGCAAETTVQQLPLSDATIAAFEARTMVAFTGESRMSSHTITAVLDAYRNGDARTCNALLTMKSLAPRMAHALRDGDIDLLGTLLAEQWTAQRALHETITTPRIERIVTDVTAAGALGIKALGASGGGCVLVIARADRVGAVRRSLGALATLLPLRVARTGVELDIGEALR